MKTCSTEAIEADCGEGGGGGDRYVNLNYLDTPGDQFAEEEVKQEVDTEVVAAITKIHISCGSINFI